MCNQVRSVHKSRQVLFHQRLDPKMRHAVMRNPFLTFTLKGQSGRVSPPTLTVLTSFAEANYALIAPRRTIFPFLITKPFTSAPDTSPSASNLRTFERPFDD